MIIKRTCVFSGWLEYGERNRERRKEFGAGRYGRWQKKGKKRELWGRHREGESTVGEPFRGVWLCLCILLLGSACTGFFSSSTLWTWWWVVLPSLPYSLGSTLSSQSAHKPCGWLNSPCLNSTGTSETSGWRLWPVSAQEGELVWSHLSTSREIRSHISGRKKASGIYLYLKESVLQGPRSSLCSSAGESTSSGWEHKVTESQSTALHLVPQPVQNPTGLLPHAILSSAL